MTTAPPNLNLCWSRLLLEELARLGVRQVVISPGSRSTPLTLAAAMTPQLSTTVHFDERGAAFFALGQARATGVPSVLIATSGTAAANYLPAVIEASQEAVPLLLLTADRPPELRHTGANQTIDQVKLYGDYVRHFVDLPCPGAELSWRLPLTSADRAYHLAVGGHPGPVHLNCMFREPLVASDAELAAGLAGWPTSGDETAALAGWAAAGQAFCTFTELRLLPHMTQLPPVIASVAGEFRRVLLVIGQLPHRAARDAAARLITRTGWPAIADITSGLRLAPAPPTLLAHHDMLLRAPALRGLLAADLIIQVGGHLTSKRLQEFLVASPAALHLRLVHDARLADNAQHLSMQTLVGHLPALLDQLVPDAVPPVKLSARTRALVAANQRVAKLLAERLDGTDAVLCEPAVARALARHLPPGQPLFLASSLAIREMDTFAGPTSGPLHPVVANRGASGIDGTVATAAGFAHAGEAPLTLLIGDLALLHDLNSLALLATLQAPLVIVVLNNDGGGIFHFLPVQRLGPLFERYFATPHGYQFEGAAAMFGLHYARPASLAAFVAAYTVACQSTRSTLIEVTTTRTATAALYDELGAAVVRALGRAKK